MVCAIHQPTFFPWLGFFNKVARCDIFVFMDDVQYPGCSSYINRVSIKIRENASYISCPVRQEKGLQQIKDVVILYNNRQEKLLKTLLYNYKRSPFFDETFPIIEQLIKKKFGTISEYNINAITHLIDIFGIRTKIVNQSSLYTTQHSTNLLVEITKAVGCDTYLCGGGAHGYQDDALIRKNGLQLVYQDFLHPTYPQCGKNFIPGLSIIDVLLNNGLEGTKSLLLSTIDK